MASNNNKKKYYDNYSIDELVCYFGAREIKSFTTVENKLNITLNNGDILTTTIPTSGEGGCCYTAGEGINITDENVIETNADLSETVEDITVIGGAGAYPDGYVIRAGTSVEEILRNLLRKVTDVEAIEPTVQIELTDGAMSGETYEVGSELIVSSTSIYTDGKFVGKDDYEYEIDAECTPLEYVFKFDNEEEIIQTDDETHEYYIENLSERTHTFSTRVHYSENNATPVKSDGSPSDVSIPEGETETASTTITGAYKFFYGYIDTGDITSYDDLISTQQELYNLNLDEGFCRINNTTTIADMFSGEDGKNSLILVLPERYNNITYTENSLGSSVNVEEKWKVQRNANDEIVTIQYVNGQMTTTYYVYILYSLAPIEYKNIKFSY